MKAADIMSTNVVTIAPSATIAEAARAMQQQQVRALIVDRADEEDAYGIVTATDISRAVAEAKNPEITSVCQIMTKPCIVVNPDLAVEHIGMLFARAKIRIAPVIKDKLLGIISLSDLLTKTDCLLAAETKLTAQKRAELAKFLEEELRKTQSEIDKDLICDNWFGG